MQLYLNESGLNVESTLTTFTSVVETGGYMGDNSSCIATIDTRFDNQIPDVTTEKEKGFDEYNTRNMHFEIVGDFELSDLIEHLKNVSAILEIYAGDVIKETEIELNYCSSNSFNNFIQMLRDYSCKILDITMEEIENVEDSHLFKIKYSREAKK